MVAVPFPLASSPGKFAESGGRMVNVFAEKLADGRVKRSRVPGIRPIIETTEYSHCRGAIDINGVVLAALDDRLVTISESGGTYTLTDIGAFSGSETVYFARNNKSPTPDIVAVTDSTAFVVDMTTGASSYPDADVGSPNSVTFQGGYFVFSYGNARMRASGLNDTSINTLDTALAESKPDGLHRVVAISKNIFACGPSTIEVWPNAGNPTGFPFSYLDTIPRGLAGPDAIAGFENDFGNVIVFAGSNNVVYKLNGYTPEAISNPSVSKALENTADKSTLKAIVYSHEGHDIWALIGPDWTWCYDLSAGSWFERKSYGSDKWRATASVKCFDKWVIGDSTTGKFGVIDPAYGFEFGDYLTWRLVSATMSGFPARAAMPRLDLDIMAGVGVSTGDDPTETGPQISVSWSRDGGVTFGSPVLRELGAQGDYTNQIRVNRLGTASAKGVQIAVEGSDPVLVSVFSGELTVEARR
jgi:hypothetical protein